MMGSTLIWIYWIYRLHICLYFHIVYFCNQNCCNLLYFKHLAKLFLGRHLFFSFTFSLSQSNILTAHLLPIFPRALISKKTFHPLVFLHFPFSLSVLFYPPSGFLSLQFIFRLDENKQTNKVYKKLHQHKET